MTRTDVMASSRPLTARETATRSLARTRRLLLLTGVIALLAVALTGPGTAIAAEGTSGYSGTPTTPTTTPKTTPTTTPAATTPATTPTTGTSPSKETSTTPASKEEPSKSSTTPAKESSSKSGTLPFTGFDLRWSFAIGLALMAAGFSIVVVQRRRSGSR